MKQKQKKKHEMFSSKANTLVFLQDKLTNGRIEKIFSFTVEEWSIDKREIIKKTIKKFFPDEIIVRSSAKGEDSIESTEAGKYKSIQKVSTKTEKEIENAVEEVINEYLEKDNDNSENQILIQKQTKNVITNGVAFTRTPENGSPYYVINFSDSDETDNVTKGETSNLVKIFRKCKKENVPKKWRALISTLNEIENIFKSEFLDIEFGITKKDIVIFQVRPLTTVKISTIKKLENNISTEIKKNQRKYQKFWKHNQSNNNQKYFSDMTDWNPAEIIGSNPNPLDYSLYEFLFMKDSWQDGRIKIGYEKEKQSNLMEKFANKPYINIKKSFYSLFPNNLNKKIKKKLMKFYLKKIKENPHLHDKVEFDILFSCYDFTFDDRKKELERFGFKKNEIHYLKEKLIEFTNKIIIDFPEIKQTCIDDTEKMATNREKIKNAISKENDNYLQYAKNLLEDCRKYGAVNFSSIARIAFIGNILLKSLKTKNIVDDKFVNEIMESISSPLSEIQNDLYLLSKNNINKNDFLQKYGHLRPGTYDITAKRYDESHEFLENIKFLTKPKSESVLNLKNTIIDKILKKEGIATNKNELIDFIRESTRLREVLKFEFTKNLSDALSLISKGGKEYGFSTDDLSYLELKNILDFKETKKSKIQNVWNKIILKNKKRKKINECIVMPPLIFSENDFQVINYNLSKPNFITTQKITANLQDISNIDNKNEDFSDKIIFIENADPGYDWIFTKNPSGLITKYGGVASHMAIRCAELRLPAAIGIGEIIFQKIEDAKTILLDCKNQQIIALENRNTNDYSEVKKILKYLGYIK